MSTSQVQAVKWGETLAGPGSPRKGASHANFNALRQLLPDGRAGQTAIALVDALQQDAGQRGFVFAMDKAGRALRAARQLHSSERRFVGDALHGIVRGLRRLRLLADRRRPTGAELYATWLLDDLLGDLLGDQLDDPLNDRADAADDASAELRTGLVRTADRIGLDGQAILARRQQLAAQLAAVSSLSEERRIDAIGDALSYPAWLVRAMVADLGLAQAVAVLRAQNERAPLTVRANALRCTRAELAERLAAEGVASTPTAVSSHGLIVDGRVNIYGTAAFADGWLEIQDEGSQMIAELVAPPPGSVVVDLCAGAGGKTLALGALLGNKGRIVAFDIDGRKLDELVKRSRRAGLSNVQAVRLPADWTDVGSAREVPDWLRQRGAERVLVDAPCSGLGVLRRHPEARWHLGPGDLDELCVKQRAILGAAASLVRADGRNPGRLIYATCTVLRRENDDVIDDFLAAHPDFAPVAAKEILGSDRALAIGDGARLRTLPTPGGPDGFFAAVLRRPR